MVDPLLPDLLSALDLAAIERRPDQTFQVVAPPAPWFVAVLESAPEMTMASLLEVLPFLHDFVRQADVFWRESRRGVPTTLDSGPFVASVKGEDLLLRASAMTIAGRMLLVLARLSGEADVRPMLQKAREHALEIEGLVRHVQSMHAPVRAIDDGLTALSGAPLAPAQQHAVEKIREANATLKAIADTRPAPPSRARRSAR